MASHRWAFIYEAPETDPVKDRVVIDRGGVRSVHVPVRGVENAAGVGVERVEDGIQFIELCGGFGPVAAAKVIAAVGDRVGVGLVKFGAESLSKVAAVFAPPSEPEHHLHNAAKAATA